MSKYCSVARTVALPIVVFTFLPGKAAAWCFDMPAIVASIPPSVEVQLSGLPRSPRPSAPPVTRRIWANYTTRRNLTTVRRRRRKGR